MTGVPDHVEQRLNRFDERVDDHETRLKSLEINEAGMAEWRRGTMEILKKIESGNIWIRRLIIGAMVSGVVGFVISEVLNGP